MSRSSRPGVLAYVQKHPYYTLEHLALICIAGLYFFSSHLACSSRSERLLADGGTLPKRPVQRGQCEEGDTYCCCPAGMYLQFPDNAFSMMMHRGADDAHQQQCLILFIYHACSVLEATPLARAFALLT